MGKVHLDIQGLLETKVSVAQVILAYLSTSDYPTFWASPTHIHYPRVDVGVIHGLSEGMYWAGNLLKHALTLLKEGVVSRLAVVGGDGSAMPPNTEPGSAWVGQEYLLNYLEQHGMRREDVLVTKEIRHSKDEAVAIVDLCREHKFMSAGSISVAYHGGRMYPYMVAAMKEASAAGRPWWIDYRMLPPRSTDWWRPVGGSQGIGIIPQVRSIIDDTMKIEQHIQKGFAASFEETLYYHRMKVDMDTNFVWDFESSQPKSE